MDTSLMTLEIILPSGKFIEKLGVSRIYVETTYGNIGLLPLRFDCVAGLVPGVLIYDSHSDGEQFVAIDEGVLVKDGLSVVVSVKNAFIGNSLEQLHKTVDDHVNHSPDKYFYQQILKIESHFINRLGNLCHD